MGIVTAAAVEKFVKAGVPGGKPHISLRDSSGLVLRLLPSGVATWFFVGRLPGAGRSGTQRMVTIGRWPAVNLTAARRMAAEIKGKVASGIDPVAERKELMRQEKTRLPVALADYETWLRSRKLTKVGDTLSALRRGFRPLERRTLEEISRPDIVGAIEKIERAGFPGAAAEFRKLAATFFNRQVTLGVTKFSPLTGYRRPKPPRDEVADAEQSGRALTGPEIVSIWRAAEQIGGSFAGVVKLILSTGLRRNEASNLRWGWIDRKSGLITIPARSMKAGSEHIVIITDRVAHILDEAPDRAGGLVFPGRALGGKRPISGWSKLLKRLRAVSGVDGVGLHDMRRTFRSALADLDVPEPVAEMMIAHKRADLIRRYNRATLLDQRRRAAATYDAWLSGLLGVEQH